MSPTPDAKPSLRRLAPQPVAPLAAEDLVHIRPLVEGRLLPLLVEPARGRVDLIAWARQSRAFLDSHLLRHGGILLRGFEIGSPERFEELITAVSGEALEYRERSSPRSAVAGHIYTSTDYPADQPIFLHNENSYAHTWPLRIFFCCQTAPRQGGETPLADVRGVFRRIQPEVRRRFAERGGVLYVRNFSEVAGLPWPTVFQTDDRTAVEEYCRKTGYDFEWVGESGLRTRRRGPAVLRHPVTGEDVWFNHATFFHPSTLPPALRDGLLELFAEEDLPNCTYYGDGTPFEPEVLDELRRAYAEETVSFPWQEGDVLMLDNMLVAHARAPFSGPRKVLVGMAAPIQAASLTARDQRHG